MDRKAYVDRIKARLDEWNAEIDRLEAKARGMEAEARIRHEAQIRELQAQRDQAEEKLRAARAAGDAAWEDMREGFVTGWEAVSTDFREALKRFG